jgi:hypothetical protein
VTVPLDRPPAAQAGPDLLVLQKWETFVGWLLHHTGKWPKAARFTLTQRLDNHALDVTEMLVQARYEPRLRSRLLHDVNLRLERMRFLCRIAKDSRVEHDQGFESTMRGLDECGRMVHGWRVAISDRQARIAEATA